MISYHGPVIGVVAAFEPDFPFGANFYGRVQPTITATVPPSTAVRFAALTFGLQLFGGNFALGNFRLAPMAEIEGTGTVASNDYRHTQVRFAVGLRVRLETPPPSSTLPQTGPGRVKGKVLSAGAGLSGAMVEASGGRPVRTDPAGEFELREVGPGKVKVRATADGHKPAEQELDVPPGGEVEVSLTLERPSGPGTIRGLVKSDKPDAPIEGAEVFLEGKSSGRTAADGSFTLEKAGPGPVKVAIKAKGFKDGEEVVQVPPEAEAQVTVVLLKQGERAPATIRGLVKSATSGKPVKATVKISEVNMNVPVKADGRFVVQVPGGKYTLSIEANGYIPQTKTVEVADGDQAIFHCDLQPAAR
jgi:hypothetical protein